LTVCVWGGGGEGQKGLESFALRASLVPANKDYV
jgi:hypothetical protein